MFVCSSLFAVLICFHSFLLAFTCCSDKGRDEVRDHTALHFLVLFFPRLFSDDGPPYSTSIEMFLPLSVFVLGQGGEATSSSSWLFCCVPPSFFLPLRSPVPYRFCSFLVSSVGLSLSLPFFPAFFWVCLFFELPLLREFVWAMGFYFCFGGPQPSLFSLPLPSCWYVGFADDIVRVYFKILQVVIVCFVFLRFFCLFSMVLFAHGFVLERRSTPISFYHDLRDLR